MNAGAEYVAYRIWATLQGPDGIHAESLLTCLGALAGYACQASVRKTARVPGADPGKFALIESPLSVWALVGRAVQKLGQPLPDIDGIVSRVTQTAGTSELSIPRVADEHRPRHPPIFYLRQIWPQIRPIAERFCRRSAQMPVLFGIALQRAIEQTKDTLNPTLGATIAMECAVAMSRVVLPEEEASPAIDPLPAPAPEVTAAPLIRAVPARYARSAITIAAVAITAIAGGMYTIDRPEAPPEVPEQEIPRLAQGNIDVPEETGPLQEEPFFEDLDARAVPAEEPPPDTPIYDESLPSLEPSSDGSDEIVISE
jgi:hypothetical protein